MIEIYLTAEPPSSRRSEISFKTASVRNDWCDATMISMKRPNQNQTEIPAALKTKIQEAEEFGIDVTLLYENLKLTPTERLQKLESMIRFVEELQRAKRVTTGGSDRSAS